MSGKSQMGLLSWTHYRTLLRVEDESAREWYAQEAFSQAWSSRTLDRNISTQYYYRMLASQKKSKTFSSEVHGVHANSGGFEKRNRKTERNFLA
ncbi:MULTISPECIES: DUF1016 N-terminal domain-containing protein [unclassified Fibrobacter]|uniref:DUF1016 N-terminal domain-containing protein n=1 Tax=unclassified Fibrobacter TaxID=2634177 RepID=UPI0031FECF39